MTHESDSRTCHVSMMDTCTAAELFQLRENSPSKCHHGGTHESSLTMKTSMDTAEKHDCTAGLDWRFCVIHMSSPANSIAAGYPPQINAISCRLIWFTNSSRTYADDIRVLLCFSVSGSTCMSNSTHIGYRGAFIVCNLRLSRS